MHLFATLTVDVAFHAYAQQHSVTLASGLPVAACQTSPSISKNDSSVTRHLGLLRQHASKQLQLVQKVALRDVPQCDACQRPTGVCSSHLQSSRPWRTILAWVVAPASGVQLVSQRSQDLRCNQHHTVTTEAAPAAFCVLSRSRVARRHACPQRHYKAVSPPRCASMMACLCRRCARPCQTGHGWPATQPRAPRARAAAAVPVGELLLRLKRARLTCTWHFLPPYAWAQRACIWHCRAHRQEARRRVALARAVHLQRAGERLVCSNMLRVSRSSAAISHYILLRAIDPALQTAPRHHQEDNHAPAG